MKGFGIKPEDQINLNERGLSFLSPESGMVESPDVKNHKDGTGKQVYFRINNYNVNFGVFRWGDKNDSNYRAACRLQYALDNKVKVSVCTIGRSSINPRDGKHSTFTDVFVMKYSETSEKEVKTMAQKAIDRHTASKEKAETQSQATAGPMVAKAPPSEVEETATSAMAGSEVASDGDDPFTT